MKIIFVSGSFTEGQKVTVLINGKEVTRNVKYNRRDGLYIIYDNAKYFESEIDYDDYYINKNNVQNR